MNLTDREKELRKGMIDHGEPPPPKYRLSLFAGAPEVDMIRGDNEFVLSSLKNGPLRERYRTRKDRALELTSAPHEYQKKGRRRIAMKVIDIFGNDTTKVVEVTA